MIRHSAAFAILASFPLAHSALQAAEPDFIYRIQKGDTLEGLARRGMHKPSDYLVVQRYNRVRNVRGLVPGSTLRIPVRLLRTQPINAKVISFRGAAQVGGAAAKIGMPVKAGQLLQTGLNAFLAMELADGSLLTLPSRSRMLVAQLHRIEMTGAAVKKFRLLSGRAETEVQPVDDKGGQFEIETPVSVAAVRGTKFRATFEDSAAASGTGVIEGNVAVSSIAGGEVVLPPGKGVVATAAGTGGPVDLLGKPQVINPDKVQDEEIVAFAIGPVSGASGYRVQLAADAGFVEVFAEADSNSPDVQFTGVGNGSFFAKATALSAEGLEGLASTYSFERRQNNVKAEAGVPDDCPAARCLRFRWRAGGEGERRFRFQLLADKEGTPIFDVPEMQGTEIILTDLPGGTYFWRVESALLENGKRMAKWTDLQELRVAPANKN